MSGPRAMASPRIVLVRHGRSAHAQRGWLDADALRAWFAAYDATGIALDDAPPAALRAEAARAGIVVASDLPRARASAERLRFQHRMSSSLVGGVGEDAAHVAAVVARRAERAVET